MTNMKQSVLKKYVILFLCIATPGIVLMLYKDALFGGGRMLPSLSVPFEETSGLLIANHGKKIPPFEFINQDNQKVNNDYYQGKIYIANFMFTRCPSICKEMSDNIVLELQKELKEYNNVYYLSHSIDPNYDTPEILKEYAGRYQNEYGVDLSKWNLVTGDKQEIYDIAKSYLTYASDSGGDENHEGFAHSSALLLIDSEGRIRSGPIGSYDGTSLDDVKQLIKDVKILVSESRRINFDIIPEFEFVNQYNQKVTNEDYLGKIYIANFMSTRSPISKTLSFHIALKLQDELKYYDNVYYLSHTIDPDYDTPEVLRQYAEDRRDALGADLSNWNFVTGNKEHLFKLAKAYLAYDIDSLMYYDYNGIKHPSVYVLIDSKGRIRSGYNENNKPIGFYDGTSASEIKQLVKDVGILVSETKRNR